MHRGHSFSMSSSNSENRGFGLDSEHAADFLGPGVASWSLLELEVKTVAGTGAGTKTGTRSKAGAGFATLSDASWLLSLKISSSFSAKSFFNFLVVLVVDLVEDESVFWLMFPSGTRPKGVKRGCRGVGLGVELIITGGPATVAELVWLWLWIWL